MVPYERLRRTDGWAELGEPVRPRQNVHGQGADYRAGDLLISAGTALRSPHAHLLATCGAPGAWVRRRCAWALAATGDELVAIQAAPLPHQIRRSNGAAIGAEAQAWGQAPQAERLLPDDAAALAAGITALAAGRDALVLTGGVSQGAFDLLPKTLEALGARMQFHGVAQKPGKPFWFGILPGGVRVFSLPGNPVASLVAFRRFVLPALLRFEGRASEPRLLSVRDLRPAGGALTHFIPVQRTPVGHRPVPPGGSGDLRPLALSEGFVEVDPGWDGSALLPYFPWGRVD
ncbi:MAG: molybdopterin-binding protein [Holophaga sp.]|nr:molybdopterin-binding protein [Holophaga sp.]